MLEILMLIPFIILLSWILYQIPITIYGVLTSDQLYFNDLKRFPKFTIIIPAKNEQVVIGRCLESILNQDYPHDKIEIIVVDGNSTDRTRDIVRKYISKMPKNIKLLRENNPRGKPSALNYALKHANGEIIAVFDADSILQRDTLCKIAALFANGAEAIQTRVKTVNKDMNILTRLISIEEDVWFRLIMKGRQKLKLFIPFTGSSLFIKKSIIDKLGGWDEKSLAEDVELSVRMLKHGYHVKYVDDIVTWQEAPSKLRSFFKQRLRWYRGYIETALKYGRLLTNPNRRSIDAEILLIGPIIMATSLLCYITGILTLVDAQLSVYTSPSIYAINIFTAITILLAIILNRPITKRKILTSLSIYAYWLLQSTIALKALIDVVLRKKCAWTKTAKSGEITITI